MTPSLLLPGSLALVVATSPARGAGPALDQVDAWDLVRVDVPDHPDAVATSTTGSVLLSPPVDTAWRVEEIAWPDRIELDEAEATAAEDAAQLALEEGDALQGVGRWRAWEAEAAMHVAAWHDAGIDGSYADGSAVKVAVFDVQWVGVELHEDELQQTWTHDCWAHRSCEVPMDTLEPRFSFEVGSHGLACAEIIRDLAPGVELHLVRTNGVTSLENAVDWAIREGIDVVSMSLSFFNNSFYDGTGPVSQLMDRLQAGGVLMVTSAGNYAAQHWGGSFRDTDGDGVHEFFDDRVTLPIYVRAGVRRVQITWDDFGRCGRTDLDAMVMDVDGVVVGRAERVQDAEADSCEPAERVRFEAAEDGWYYLALIRKAGVPDVRVDVLARDGEVWEGIPAGSVTDPGAHPAVLTVGAVRAVGYLDNGPEYFTSVGPTNGGFPKPDLAGPDGISTSVYGPTGFYGTSAATPSVAAAIALVMSSEPGIDAAEAARRLQGHVLSGDPVWQGPDPALGAGKVRLAAPPGTQAARTCATSPAPPAGLLLPLLLLPLRRRRQRSDGPAGTLPRTSTESGAP